MQDLKTGFLQGVVYAAARLIDMYDQPTLAISIIKEAGYSASDLNVADEYDLGIIREHWPELPIGNTD